MIWVGLVVVLQGFGSAIARSMFDRDFGLLWWARDQQPWVGIAIGLVGLGIVGASQVRRKQDA